MAYCSVGRFLAMAGWWCVVAAALGCLHNQDATIHVLARPCPTTATFVSRYSQRYNAVSRSPTPTTTRWPSSQALLAKSGQQRGEHEARCIDPARRSFFRILLYPSIATTTVLAANSQAARPAPNSPALDVVAETAAAAASTTIDSIICREQWTEDDPLAAFAQSLRQQQQPLSNWQQQGVWPQSACSPLPPTSPSSSSSSQQEEESNNNVEDPNPGQAPETLSDLEEALEKAKRKRSINPLTHG